MYAHRHAEIRACNTKMQVGAGLYAGGPKLMMDLKLD